MLLDSIYEIYKQNKVITTDSRNCPEGSIFFALKGGNFDGNRFVLDALAKGCSYAVSEDRRYSDNERVFVVEDVLTTLQQLAHRHRSTFNFPVIGITGTNGKTTTKELVATVLSKKYRVHYTQGNFNNHIGVPLTLLSTPADCDMAVIEMGANHPGEIAALTSLAMPTCGIITNVGKAHLEGFGSFEGVIKTKKELYDNVIANNGHIFVNAADKNLADMLDGYKNITTYSADNNVHANINATLTDCSPYLKFTWEDNHIETRFVGTYNLNNMLAAIAVGVYFNIDREKITDALTTYKPANNRSQLQETGRNTLIVDAYNANPTSMGVAIENFAMIKSDNKIAIIGDMLELGDSSEAEHATIIEKLKATDIKEVFLVGKEFGKLRSKFKSFSDRTALADYLESSPISGAMILIKGSNGIGLKEIVPLL